MPLNVKHRANIEQVALAIHPQLQPTVLEVKSRTRRDMPLAGYEVFEYEKDVKEAAALVGRTDWRGRLTVAPNERTLRFFLVKNGGDLLARLPIAPASSRF